MVSKEKHFAKRKECEVGKSSGPTNEIGIKEIEDLFVVFVFWFVCVIGSKVCIILC